MYCYTTETLLLLKHGFHQSRELVNDQSSVSSCNQNPGSHAEHKDKLGGNCTAWTLESRFVCTDKHCTVFTTVEELNFPSFNWLKTQIPKLSGNIGNVCRNALQVCHLCLGLSLIWRQLTFFLTSFDFSILTRGVLKQECVVGEGRAGALIHYRRIGRGVWLWKRVSWGNETRTQGGERAGGVLKCLSFPFSSASGVVAAAAADVTAYVSAEEPL